MDDFQPEELTALRKILWIASYPKSGNTWIRIVLDAYAADTAIGPDTADKDSNLVLVASDSGTTTVGTGGPWTSLKQTNARRFAVKGRYLRFRYKLKNAFTTSETIKFGAKLLKLYSQAYQA